jgi:hypothetical protein
MLGNWLNYSQFFYNQQLTAMLFCSNAQTIFIIVYLLPGFLLATLKVETFNLKKRTKTCLKGFNHK